MMKNSKHFITKVCSMVFVAVMALGVPVQAAAATGVPMIGSEAGNTRIDVEVEVVSETVETHRTTDFEYSDAIGQVTVTTQDQDGAQVNIQVDFGNGESIIVENWEVTNGSRVFTWVHPSGDHDTATVKVWVVDDEAMEYISEVVQVSPTYTCTISTTEWTTTLQSCLYHYTLIEIADDGSETVVDTWSQSGDVVDESVPSVQSTVDFIMGDREITIAFGK